MSQTTVHEARVNNATLAVETTGDDPTIGAKRLLSETGFHPGSYALFTDAYADADSSETPALFDDRLGERVALDRTVDLSERRRFIAVLKREL